ncbi:MAG: hypothetical protein JWM80_282 [Cyanobacteria bacterium RYN_339]|nr:hypothetical protein [Cyanobacteria bacterium RYN_339]
MTLGINGLGNSKSNSGAANKRNAKEASVAKEEALVAAGDALALNAPGPVTATSSRQLAREFAEKLTRLQGADPVAYDQLADNIGTTTYVLVDTVNRLCRDTQTEPFEERVKALNMIEHVHGLPDDVRQMIEEDLRRTSAA